MDMIYCFAVVLDQADNEIFSSLTIPPLLRQETVASFDMGGFSASGGVSGDVINRDTPEPSAFDTGLWVNGQFQPPLFRPLADGMWGYDFVDTEHDLLWMDDSGDEYEREDFPESDSDVETVVEVLDSMSVSLADEENTMDV